MKSSTRGAQDLQNVSMGTEAIGRNIGPRSHTAVNSEVASTLNTAPRRLKLDRGIKFILEKILAQFEANPQSTTREDLPDGST